MGMNNVEYNTNFKRDNDVIETDKTIIMITPSLDDNYWIFRVKLHKNQSVVAFPKFTTIGIGFAIEDDDWNTNLPYTCEAQVILDHIWSNHKYKEITKEQTLEAIKLLQEACGIYRMDWLNK